MINVLFAHSASASKGYQYRVVIDQGHQQDKYLCGHSIDPDQCRDSHRAVNSQDIGCERRRKLFASADLGRHVIACRDGCLDRCQGFGLGMTVLCEDVTFGMDGRMTKKI